MTYGSPQVRSRSELRTVTIAAIASLSDAIDLNGFTLAGIIFPAAWTAASVTFAVSTSETDAAYNPLYTKTAEYEITAAAADRVITGLGPDFLGVQGLKVRSGTAGAPVNQAAERVITLILERL